MRKWLDAGGDFLRRIKRRILHEASKPFDRIAYFYSNNASLYACRRLRSNPAEKQRIIDALISSPSILGQHCCVISMVGASRKIDNPNNRLYAFCESIIKKTHDLKRVEMILRIDDDDDLIFYQNIQKKYGAQFNMRFVVGARKDGYLGLHRLVSEILPHLASNSKIAFGVADDCSILLPSWDNAFIKIVKNYPDNIFLINTGRDFCLPYDSKDLFFSKLWNPGPPSLFTAVGRRVLETTADIARNHTGWTAYGNSVMCDSFFETLQFYLWEMTGQNRAPIIANTITRRMDTVIASHKDGGTPFKASTTIANCYANFMKEETQSIIREMAATLVTKMKLGPQ